jgi:hypothetical protein
MGELRLQIKFWFHVESFYPQSADEPQGCGGKTTLRTASHFSLTTKVNIIIVGFKPESINSSIKTKFLLQNNLCEFRTRTQKFKGLFCNRNIGLNIDFQDF